MSTPKKYLDNNGLLYVWNKIKALIDSKLLRKADTIKVEGNKVGIYSGSSKLSEASLPISENGTTDYSALINKPQINGNELVGNKTLSQLGINIPTNISSLTNDSGYQTSSQVQSAITSAIAGVSQIDYQVVTQLPTSGKKGTVYLLSNTDSGDNTFDEYIYVNNKFERLGSKQIDLSGYLLKSDIAPIGNTEIDQLLQNN